jgi:chaperonin GroEL
MKKNSGNYGYDGSIRSYVDLVDAGIVDATKVVRVALENAVSIASVLLLTQATITDEPAPAETTQNTLGGLP